jgi:predicted exporter
VSAAGRVAVLAWAVLMAGCAWIAWHARYTADVSAFLPRTPSPSQQILVDELRQGVVSRLILVGIEGAPAPVLTTLSQALADRLAHEADFAYVNNGSQSRLAADGEFLLRHRYLLSPGVTPERFTAAGLREALENDLALLGSAFGTLVSRLLPSDPTGEFLRLLELLEPEAGPRKQDGVWFSPDGTRALLLLQTRAAGFDIDAQERALARIRVAFDAAAAQQGAVQARLLATGPGVFAVSARAGIQQDVSRISLLAALLVSVLLLVVYRSPRALLLTLLPAASGATAGVAAVSLAFGSVHGVTLGFGATLLGEGVDYAIYLFTNTAPGSTPRRSLARIWPTLTLGVLTSAVGFSALLLSQFTGLAQLGLFSIVGLIVAYVVTRYVLPELIPNHFAVRPAAALGSAFAWLAGRAGWLRLPLLGLVVLSAVWLASLGSALWDDRLESLSPVAESDKRLDEAMRRELGAPDVRYLVVAAAASQQAVLRAAEGVGAELERSQRAGSLGGFESPALILPSDVTQRARQTAIPGAGVLRENLDQAADGLPFQPQLFEPFLQEASAARQAPLINAADLKGTGLALRLESLLTERHDGWMAMLPLRAVREPAAVAGDLRGVNGVHLLDLKAEANALYRSYRGQALRFALIGAGAIALLLLASLRSPRRAAEALLPLAAAVLVTCALLSLGARQLTIFNLVGLLLVVGVGSNYTLFFERETFARTDPQRTLVSLACCNASTVIGFGLLSLARAPVLSAIGTTVAVGAFLSLLFGAILAAGRAARG